jgi:hypothetical protein
LLGYSDWHSQSEPLRKTQRWPLRFGAARSYPSASGLLSKALRQWITSVSFVRVQLLFPHSFVSDGNKRMVGRLGSDDQLFPSETTGRLRPAGRFVRESLIFYNSQPSVDGPMARNPRTARLLVMTGMEPASLRLRAADRAFLRDLAKVQLISSDLAQRHHYSHLKGGEARPLSRLEEAGIIRSKTLHVPGRAPVRTYEFASSQVAKAFGGLTPVTGAKRTDLHELITSRIYFELGRPESFRVASKFSREDVLFVGSHRPDAMFTDPSTGEVVLVEADSGQYNRTQILEKVVHWRSLGLHRQVWGQPHFAAANVPTGSGVEVMRF